MLAVAEATATAAAAARQQQRQVAAAETADIARPHNGGHVRRSGGELGAIGIEAFPRRHPRRGFHIGPLR